MFAMIRVFVPTVLLLACGGATGPEPQAGEYLLDRVNGTGLPHRLVDDGMINVDLVDGSYALTADGRFTASHTHHILELSTGAARDSVVAESGVWIALRDQGIQFISPEADGEFLADGTFTSSTLSLRDIRRGLASVYVR